MKLRQQRFTSECFRPKAVRFGNSDLDIATPSVQMRKFYQNHVTKHPKYAPPKSYYDVALIFLEQEIPFSAAVSPICLPTGPSEDVDKYKDDLMRLAGI